MDISTRIRHFWHLVSNVRPIVWIGIYLGLIPLFALIYYWLPTDQFHSPDKAGTDYGSWLYYSVVTITTLGFGDYTPTHRLAQTLTAVEVACGISIFGFFLNAVGSMRSEIDVESELEKQRRVHYLMEREKLIKYLPVILHRLQAYINICDKYSSEENLKNMTRSEMHYFLSDALRTSLFLDSLLSRIDLSLWSAIIEDSFLFVAAVQTHESTESYRKIRELASNTSEIAANLQTEFTKASTLDINEIT